MSSENREDLLYRPGPPEPSLIYRYSPARSLAAITAFLVAAAGVCLFFLSKGSPVAVVPGILALVLLYHLLRTCSVRIHLDWPNLVYRYRSVFRRIDRIIPSWEIEGFSPEITSMWRGVISDRLVIETRERNFVVTPFYSESDVAIRRLRNVVHGLPDSRKQAEYELELERRILEGRSGEREDESRMEMVWCMLEMNIRCPRCEGPVVVNGPFTEFDCSDCGEGIELTPEIWTDLMEDIREEIAEDTVEGEGHRSTIWGTFDTTLFYGRQTPYCPDCKRDLDVPETCPVEGVLVCPDCGRRLTAAPSPDWFGGVFEGVRLIVSTPAEDPGEGGDNGPEPVSCTCDRCGASMLLDGRSRTVECDHCGSAAYLPDELWHHFHPVPVKRRWFVGFMAEVVEP